MISTEKSPRWNDIGKDHRTDFPTVIGHRGAAGTKTENTIESFKEAIRLGCRYLECDIQEHSGSFIVFHDRTLERLTEDSGELQSKPLATLLKLELIGGGRIPLLQDVLKLLPGKAALNIELKGSGFEEKLTAFLNKHLPEAGINTDQILLSNEERESLLALKKLGPNFPLGLVVRDDLKDAVNFALEHGISYLSVKHTLIDFPLQETPWSDKITVLAYTVNELQQAKELSLNGVSGVFSDYPQRFQSY